MTDKLFEISNTGYNLTRLPANAAYPDRQVLDDSLTDWQVPVQDYEPAFFTHPAVEAAEGDWADSSIDPADIAAREQVFGTVEFDDEGYPLNPHGRTGLAGRGLLGLYGANVVVDMVATDPSYEQILAVLRPNGFWAFPGGFFEKEETLEEAVLRETLQETHLDLGHLTLKHVIEPALFIPNNRITDNAWIESVQFAAIVEEIGRYHPRGGDDAPEARWMPIVEAQETFLPAHRYILNQYLGSIEA